MSDQKLTVLGIESSCDETAAAVLRLKADGSAEVLADCVHSQIDDHAPFGGVVPEIAARAHVERLDHVVAEALEQAGLSVTMIDAVAVTSGPGLIGGVLAGVACAKAIATAAERPMLGVNHLEGHALTPRLTDGLAYPYLLLLASGGHCQLLMVEALGRYKRLGGSIDDSPGEAFDKLAKHLGLGFPGGPEVESRAAEGDPERFKMPRPLLDRAGCDMSFSGLKTAARLAADGLVAQQGGLYEQDINDLCAGFQAAACDALSQKTRRAIAAFQQTHPAGRSLAVAGGVAANRVLRAKLSSAAEEAGLQFAAPPLALCTDNAAMIAWAGAERLARGETHDRDAIIARPRWPLDETAEPLIGSGKRGAKA
ncbi:MAG: tRNA (adenosine(37)-N6)-threonylcarbamoyltransferase complex transferase subunit TsaD [Rhodobacteraceae bacterium]|nr:tRNA (adenosine(37)-N6)-threonylcarbamoyltransferase complex transferase subunit TsaD [Paracoccaceae bacterium]